MLVQSRLYDLDWLEDSATIQGDFFISSEIFIERLRNKLIYEDFDIATLTVLFFAARNAGQLPLPETKDGKRRFEQLFKTDATLMFEVLVTRVK